MPKTFDKPGWESGSTRFSIAETVPTPPPPPPPPTQVGRPFGPQKLWKTTTAIETVGVASFTASFDYTSPANIIGRINAARTIGKKLLLAMTDDRSPPSYMKDTNGDGIMDTFDLVKWKAAMDLFFVGSVGDPTTIRGAIASGIADGIIVGNSVMDEPKNKKWGAEGNITKDTIDQMCDYARSLFPGLLCGVATVHWWRRNEVFQKVDFIIDQYDWWQPPNGPGTTGAHGGGGGNVTDWVTAAQAFQTAERAGSLDGKAPALVLFMNVLDGGTEVAGCPIPTTGGKGTYLSPNDPATTKICRMTAAQVKTFGLALGAVASMLGMWRYDVDMMSQAAYQSSCADLAAAQAALGTIGFGRT